MTIIHNITIYIGRMKKIKQSKTDRPSPVNEQFENIKLCLLRGINAKGYKTTPTTPKVTPEKNKKPKTLSKEHIKEKAIKKEFNLLSEMAVRLNEYNSKANDKERCFFKNNGYKTDK